MIKLLLRIEESMGSSNRSGLRRKEIDRPVVWHVCPRVGEHVFVSSSQDYSFDVLKVVHWPMENYIEVFFETDDPEDLVGLMAEEDGVWLDGEANINWARLIWPTLEDQLTPVR